MGKQHEAENTKENQYTPEEVPFADGKGTKLEQAMPTATEEVVTPQKKDSDK